MAKPEEEITVLLHAARDRRAEEARDRLFRAVEGELRKLARSLTSGRPADAAVQTTLLVDEAFLRLVNDPSRDWTDRAAYYRVAYGTMRRVLADAGRRRRPEALPDATAGDRAGAGGDPVRTAEGREELALLARAVSALEAEDPPAASAFLLYFFRSLPPADVSPDLLLAHAEEGLTLKEMAALSGQPVSTVHRHLGRAIQYLAGRV